MAAPRRLLPPWLAPAAAVGEVTKFERVSDGVKGKLMIPVGSRDLPLELTVPDDPNEVTLLASALQELARVLLEHRPEPRQRGLKGVT